MGFLRLQVSNLKREDGYGGVTLQRFLDESTTCAESAVDAAELLDIQSDEKTSLAAIGEDENDCQPGEVTTSPSLLRAASISNGRGDSPLVPSSDEPRRNSSSPPDAERVQVDHGRTHMGKGKRSDASPPASNSPANPPPVPSLASSFQRGKSPFSPEPLHTSVAKSKGLLVESNSPLSDEKSTHRDPSSFPRQESFLPTSRRRKMMSVDEFLDTDDLTRTIFPGQHSPPYSGPSSITITDSNLSSIDVADLDDSHRMLHLATEEYDAITRLRRLGFSRSMAYAAYSECEKDEARATVYLLTPRSGQGVSSSHVTQSEPVSDRASNTSQQYGTNRDYDKLANSSSTRTQVTRGTTVRGSNVMRSFKNVAKGYSSVQVKVRNATCNGPQVPTNIDMSEIAALSFNNASHFYEIIDMLDKRLHDSGRNWRHVLKSLILLDYLLHEGSALVVTWARKNVAILDGLKSFQFRDEEDKDRGGPSRSVRKVRIIAI